MVAPCSSDDQSRISYVGVNCGESNDPTATMPNRIETGKSHDWFLRVTLEVPQMVQCITKAFKLFLSFVSHVLISAQYLFNRANDKPMPHTCMSGTHDMMPMHLCQSDLNDCSDRETNPSSDQMITASLVAYCRSISDRS